MCNNVYYEVFQSDSAVIQEINGIYTIYYNENKPNTHNRFSIAREWGHYELGHDFDAGCKNMYLYRKQEIAANRFAAQLLMPMRITGDRLKIIGDSQFAGIYFAPVLESGKINSDETAWIKVDKVFKNAPKELSFILPSQLIPDSNYFVIIRTFGGRSNKAYKTLKSAIGTNPIKINVA